MVSAVYTRRSGLVVAEESADETSLQRALEQLDPRLILTREVDGRHGCFVWFVHVVVADDRPAVYVCRWDDDRGMPLPLSSGLLERVRAQLHRDDRDGITTTDIMNAQRQVEVDRMIEEASLEAARMVARFGSAGHSGLLPRGQHLRRARVREDEKKARKRHR